MQKGEMELSEADYIAVAREVAMRQQRDPKAWTFGGYV